MEPSPYLKIFDLPDVPDEKLVFSTLRASLARVPTPVAYNLARGVVPEGAADTLTRLGVVVPDAETERRRAFAYLDEVNRVSPVVTVAVVLGMACNFGCAYCYEGAEKGADALTDDMVRGLVSFVSDLLGAGKTRLVVNFYGGEPLLYVQKIRQIARVLGATADAKGAKFEFTLVTNGSLLTLVGIGELSSLGLVGVKVTLDGPPDIHDETRPYRSGRPSFDTIVKNLKACCDRIPIGLGGNYTKATWYRFSELLDRLEAEGLGPERIRRIQFGPVIAARGCPGCASVGEPWLAEAAVALRAEALRRGYRVPRLSPTPCMIDLDAAVTVHWDGTLVKCPALVGEESFRVGDLTTGVLPLSEAYGGQGWHEHQPCFTCPYLPLCFGGCRYFRYARTGAMNGVECMKAYYDAALGPMVRQDAALRQGPSTSTTDTSRGVGPVHGERENRMAPFVSSPVVGRDIFPAPLKSSEGP